MHAAASDDEGAVFHVRREGDRSVVRGTARCSFGHRIDRGPAERPDGVHAAWEWDGTRLRAENDRFGMYPLFYFGNGDEFAIASSIPGLLRVGAARDLDWPALAVFLRIGFYVGEDTAFRAIRVLPPGCALEWGPGHLDVQGGYSFVKCAAVSRQAAVDGYVELFRQAIARRVPAHDEFAVPLSGGRDSRHILLELCAQRRPPRFCITGRRFPPGGAEDERIAAQVAAAAGVEHVVVGPPRREVASLATANVRTNFTAPRRAWKLAVAERLRESVHASYDGIGGDMLSAGALLDRKSATLMEGGRYHEYAQSLFRTSEAALRRLLPGAAYRRLGPDVALARLEAEVARHADAPNPATSFTFWNRTRRFNSTSPYGIYSDLTVYSPFLDHDLYDFLASLPAELTLDRGLHDEAIRAAYPSYAHVPYEGPEAPVRSRRRATEAARDLAALLLRHRPRRLVAAGAALARVAVTLCSAGGRPVPAWSLPLIVYLTQVDAVTRSRAGA